MDTIQSIWPQWDIVEKIGQGAYGKVYKIRRKDVGYISYAAMKIIEFPQDQSEVRELLNSGMDFQSVREYYDDIKNNLLNEIRVMESLKTGRNIVAIEDHCFKENSENIGWSIYIRMELLESLDNYLLRMKELPAEEVIKIGVDICGALECCEQSHVIHRDIKPDNIFRNKYGDYKLGDFGIAKQMEQTKSAYSHKGTSMYMAPEVYRGERYNRSVDTYSLGIMLYRLLNRGRYPFMPPASVPMVQSDQENALRKRMNGETMPLPECAKNLLGSIILKACAYKPEWRYESAAEWKAELLKVSKQDSVTRDRNLNAPNSPKTPTAPSGPGIQRDVQSPKISENEKTYGAWEDSQRKSEAKKTESVKSEPRQQIPPISRIQENKNVNKKNEEKHIYHWEPKGEKDEPIANEKKEKSEKRAKKKKWKHIGIISGIILAVTLPWGYYESAKSAKEELFEYAKIIISYSRAEDQYQLAIQKYSNDSRGYLGLAGIYEAQGFFEDALDVLEQGKENCTVIDGINEQYDKIVAKKDYSDRIEAATQFVQAGDLEQAIVAYLQFIQDYESSSEAYVGLIQCYIKHNNLAEADKWLQQSASILAVDEQTTLTKEYTLQEINNKMNNADYAGLVSYFSGDKEVLGEDTYYFQNGEIQQSSMSGTGMIVSMRGVYTGEIAEGNRSGQGKQFGVYDNNDDARYHLIDGKWGNNKANGQCTYTYTSKSTAGEEWVWTYTGNITDNLYNGEITVQWSKPDGSEAGMSVIHADKGTFPIIREEEGRFIFIETDTWNWSRPSKEDLQGNGIWSFY